MTNRIRELRLQKKLTLEEIAERAGTSVQQLSRLELGERRLTDDWMRRLADALEVHPFELPVPDIELGRNLAKELQDIEILRIWRRLDKKERRVVVTFMDALLSDPDRIDPRCPYDTERRRA